MKVKKILAPITVVLLLANSYSVFDSNINNKLISNKRIINDVNINTTLKETDNKIKALQSTLDEMNNNIDSMMSEFEKKLEEQLNRLDMQLDELDKKLEEIADKMPYEVADMLDEKLDNYFFKLDEKFDEDIDGYMKKLDTILGKIDEVKLNEKIMSNEILKNAVDYIETDIKKKKLDLGKEKLENMGEDQKEEAEKILNDLFSG